MQKWFLYLLGSGFVILLLNSCQQNQHDIVNPPPGTGPTPGVDTTNHNTATTTCADCNWQFELDGVSYSGTMDTSFYSFSTMGSRDTTIYFTGTSNDKKANIYIRLAINRRAFPGPINSSAYKGMMTFDTSSTKLFSAAFPSSVNITFQVDSFNLNRLKVSFDGTISDGLNHQVRNGRLTAEFGKGTMEPKFFTFLGDTTKLAGFWNQASFQSNSLVLEGITYGGYADEKLKIIVHTGASIRPGNYQTTLEQGLLSVYFPSLYFFYICNDPGSGSLQMTIDSVLGNIVKAHYGGLLWNGRNVSGTFQCRVKNYTPYIDSTNKWKYIEQNIASFYSAFYGGNILNATKSFDAVNYRHYRLTVNGESDKMFSSFKMAISSTLPIDTGTYTTTFTPQSQDRIIDSLYFKSPAATVMNHSMNSPQKVYCHIDSINAVRVVGQYWQDIPGTQNFRQGRFRANF